MINIAPCKLIPMLAMIAICGMNLGAAPTSPSGVPKPQVHSAHIANPHLHGVSPAVVKAAASHAARHWRGRWSFSSWAVLHRGLGTVMGRVTTASGSPDGGVRVALRGARGKVLAHAKARHITHTGAGGTFLMTNVRVGNYRVRATKGKAVASSPIHVGAGSVSTTSVRM